MFNFRLLLSSATKYIKDNQPVGITGSLIHSYYWLTSNSNDYVYSIPYFKPKDNDEGAAIYCIHGTADYPYSLARIAERLIAKGGLKNINSITLVSFTKRYRGRSIDDFSEEFLEKIKVNKHKKIIIIGHSRGGLVAAKTALEAAKHGIEVAAVIALGTPFNGSYLALPPLSSLSASVKQMEIGHEFLKNLAEEVSKSTIPHYFMIAEHDEIVPSGAFIKACVEANPLSMTVFPRHTHLSLVSSHKLIAKIHAIITGKNLAEVNPTLVDEGGYEEDLFGFFSGNDLEVVQESVPEPGDEQDCSPTI
ncbi:putative lipase [Legionella beliardensis]|uniref:Putative lipase n=1 Tax=Legionella beliardensis TaxID=91822 RepID=A0A378I118_9GAMM|nr:alpha/beta hydrolase [Legionella beliardensis]STX28662.1 putative lipase [Legionella beliardensis]